MSKWRRCTIIIWAMMFSTIGGELLVMIPKHKIVGILVIGLAWALLYFAGILSEDKQL